MSDTADSTLNALKALIAAFQTGATPATVKASTAKPPAYRQSFPGRMIKREKSPPITPRGRKPNTTSAGACRRAERRPKATMPGSTWRGMLKSQNIPRTKKRNRAARPACISACSLTVPAVMKKMVMKCMARETRR